MALVLALCACGSKSGGSAQARETVSPAYKAIDGYNGYKLGSSFEDVLQAGNATDLFNPYGLKQCFDDLARCRREGGRNLKVA